MSKFTSDCESCGESWCDDCDTHYTECSCPGPHEDDGPSTEDIERMMPWALPLRMIRFRVAAKSQECIPFGQMIKEACEHYKVDYPPSDVEGTMLMLATRWAMSGAPAPVEEMV